MLIALMAAAVATSAECSPCIRVTGRAEIEAAPDYFTMEATLRGRGTTREAALSAAAAALARVNDAAPRLDGMKSLKLTSTDALAEPMRGRGCDDYDNSQDCPITGYRTAFTISLKGAPAVAAGSAFSLLSELGGEDLELGAYGLDDAGATMEKALKAAVADARRKANAIAAASGSRVNRLVAATYKNAGSQNYVLERDEIVVTGGRITPKIDVPLAPEPLKIAVEVDAAFLIE